MTGVRPPADMRPPADTGPPADQSPPADSAGVDGSVVVPLSTFLSEARSQRYASMFCAYMHELAGAPLQGEGEASVCHFRGE